MTVTSIVGRAPSRRPLVAALCCGYFLVLLDVTVVNVALPQIGAGLHTAGAGLAWVVDAYSVPLASLLLASGAIGDRLGHRDVVIAGFAAFGAASVLCALASDMAVLVAGRALQGAGAALALPGTLAVLASTAPDERARTRVVGIWAAVGGAALPAGPLVGGLLVEAASWRAVFWVSVPVILAALPPIVRLPRDEGSRSQSPDGARRDAVGRNGVDQGGAVLLVAGMGGAVTAVIEAGANVALAVAFGVLAVFAGAGFLGWERRATHPLLRVPRAARRPLAAACLVAGLMNLCSLGSLFLLTQTFQDVHRLSPLASGLLLLPAMLPLPLLGTTAGRLAGRVGAWRASALGLLVAAVGLAGVAVGLGGLRGIGGPGYPLLLVSLAVWGTGLGLLTPAIVAAALRAVPGGPGIASGASNTARQAGGALGVAVFAAFAGNPGSGGNPGSAVGAAFAGHSARLLGVSALLFAVAAGLCFALPGDRRG